MDHILQERLDYLNGWKSPFLRQCSFACFAQVRESSGNTIVSEFRRSLDSLNKKLDFDGKLNSLEQVVDFWPTEPDEDDFETSDEFEKACEELWPGKFDTKPWLTNHFDSDVRHDVLEVMKWSINNKSYEIKDKDGKIIHVPFSHDPDEKNKIAEQEKQHQTLVNEFVSNASQLFSNDGPVSLHVFRTSSSRCYQLTGVSIRRVCERQLP